MEVHANAKLGPKGRLVMVERVVGLGWSLAQAAAAAGVSDRTCRKWVERYLAEGELGLIDRSSAPRRVANRTPEATVEAIAALRRLRFTGEQIAELLGPRVLDGLGDPDADRDGAARPARLGAREPLRVRAAR